MQQIIRICVVSARPKLPSRCNYAGKSTQSRFQLKAPACSEARHFSVEGVPRGRGHEEVLFQHRAKSSGITSYSSSSNTLIRSSTALPNNSFFLLFLILLINTVPYPICLSLENKKKDYIYVDSTSQGTLCSGMLHDICTTIH